MKKRIFISILSFSFIFVNALLAQVKPTDAMPSHPRLLWTKADEFELKERIKNNPTEKAIHQLILNECDEIVLLPEVTYQKIGRRLLNVSRESEKRILYLSYAYRISAEKKYLQRAEKEMLAVSAFADWNPSHFLDVAEMSLGLAIGYDWLYDQLSSQTREIVAEALIKKGIEPSLSGNKDNSWITSHGNWNQVCNAGISFAVVALFERNPQQAADIVNRAIKTVKQPMENYANNGAYPEGYMYWEYGTGFNILLINMLDKIWDTNFGLTEMPGFMSTATFRQQLEGPPTSNYQLNSGKITQNNEKIKISQCFNFSDCGNLSNLSPSMYWFASKTKDSSLLYNEVERLKLVLKINPKLVASERFLPMMLIWSNASSFGKAEVPTSKMYVAQGEAACATMRTSWTDPNAIFVGVKGGTAGGGHAHMDIGSFVMDADGVRWAMDFGLQSYNSLESKGINLFNRKQDSQRWDVFRLNNMAHNTLTINNKKQLVSGHAAIDKVVDAENQKSVSMNLTSVYAPDVESVIRGIGLLENKYVLVQDKIKSGNTPVTVRWNLATTTDAKIIDDKTILLTLDGKKLTIQLVGDVLVKSKIWSTVSENSYDESNGNSVMVGFELSIPANTDNIINTYLIPGDLKIDTKNTISLL